MPLLPLSHPVHPVCVFTLCHHLRLALAEKLRAPYRRPAVGMGGKVGWDGSSCQLGVAAGGLGV